MIAPITKSFCGGWAARSARTVFPFRQRPVAGHLVLPRLKKSIRVKGNRYSAHGEMAVFIV